MFFTKPDASKFAFYHLVQFALKNNFAFIDAQQPTDHLASLGAKPIPRKDFLEMLGKRCKGMLCGGGGRKCWNTEDANL